ncbi:uncharacterized protein LOC117010239, partial [Catharus ustulatus]|uniref:uncharacterized protein LOC117010239 n=1 Tax=Catharus ustulatus TaxID=91951 RepID=UPI0014093BD0
MGVVFRAQVDPDWLQGVWAWFFGRKQFLIGCKGPSPTPPMPLPPTPPPPRRPSRPISRVSGRAPPPPWAEGAGEGLEEATPPSWGPSPTLGSFEIVRSLGRGSRGEVLEVRRLSDGSRFALKRSLRPLSGPAQRRHWLRECHAQRGAGPAPGLLPLLAAWEQRGRFHLLTPLCPAGSLGHLWRRGARRGGASPLRGVASVLRGVASPVVGAVSFLWGVVSRFWRETAKRGGALSARGVASYHRGVASVLRGVASFLRGVALLPGRIASSPGGVPSTSGGVASSAGGVASTSRGVSSAFKGVPVAFRGVASLFMGVASSLRGVASFLTGRTTSPLPAPSPLADAPEGGVATQNTFPLAARAEVGVSSPRDLSPSPNQRRVGVAEPKTGVSNPESAIFEPAAASGPTAASEPPDGRPMAEWRLRGYLWDVLVALSHLHARPLAHGDVKPDNVLLDAAGRCRLADFGLATPLFGRGGGGEMGGGGGGDPRYVAPEGLAGEGGTPGDIFSLGLTVAELAGERRLPGAGEGWRRIRSGGGGAAAPGKWGGDGEVHPHPSPTPPPPPSGLSPELQAVLAAMLDPDPRLRPSAPELLGGEVLRGAGRWRPLTRLADLGLRLLEDWLEEVPAAVSGFRFRFRGWVWGPRTPPRPPRADPWALRGEEEE